MFQEPKKVKEMIILISLIFLVIIVSVIAINKKENPQEPVVEEQIVEDSEERIIKTEKPVEIIEEVKQEVASSILKLKIKKTIDKTTTISYIVDVGQGETKVESQVKITNDTVILDAYEGIVVGPAAISDNMDVTFYGTGNYNIGDLKAQALVIGDSKNLKFGKLKEVYSEGEYYIGKISNTSNFIRMTKDIVIENGYTNKIMQNIEEIKPLSNVFYYTTDTFEQTEDGLIQDITKLIVIPNVK